MAVRSQMEMDISKEAKSKNIILAWINPPSVSQFYYTLNIKHLAVKFPNQESDVKTAKEIVDEMTKQNFQNSSKIEAYFSKGQKGVWYSCFINYCWI